MPEINGSIGMSQLLSGDPTIQNITGTVSMSSGGRKEVISATTEEWNSKPRMVSAKDVIYVYTDHQIVDGRHIPGIKIGDGVTPLIDAPFVSGGSEVTDEQIDFWNNKVSAAIDPQDPENLILSTT